MPGGGCLTLRAENMMVDDAQAAGFAGVRPGMFVVMSVSASAGTMGASGVCSLEQYGGFVSLERRSNLGSVARIHVPAGPAQIDPDTADVDIDALRGRDELILLVDDEVSVRSIAARMLRAYGYRVLTAANGAEAVAEFARRPGQIAAVITDIMMPVMNGAHTVRALRTIDPQVVVLAVTGLDCGEAMFEGQDRVDAVLQKPLHAEAMLRALRTALGHK